MADNCPCGGIYQEIQSRPPVYRCSGCFCTKKDGKYKANTWTCQCGGTIGMLSKERIACGACGKINHILKDPCPECRGTIRDTELLLSCLDCDWTKVKPTFGQIRTAADLARFEASSKEPDKPGIGSAVWLRGEAYSPNTPKWTKTTIVKETRDFWLLNQEHSAGRPVKIRKTKDGSKQAKITEPADKNYEQTALKVFWSEQDYLDNKWEHENKAKLIRDFIHCTDVGKLRKIRELLDA